MKLCQNYICFLHHLKALNERISKWAHLLNLVERFQRYLNFSAPKNVFFLQDLEGTYISEMGPKRKFLEAFLQLSGNKRS